MCHATKWHRYGIVRVGVERDWHGPKNGFISDNLQEHLSREMQNARRFWTNVERQAKPMEFNTKILWDVYLKVRGLGRMFE